jgi:lysophospholipase L1-like esterase
MLKNIKQTEGKNNFRQTIFLAVLAINIGAVILLLMGWPTSSGPYKPNYDYFLLLGLLSALLVYHLRRLQNKFPSELKKFIFSGSFILFLSLITAFISSEAVVRVLRLAESGGGQGPLQPDFGLSKYRLNSMGFRGPEANLVKEKGKIRIVGLGDSQIFGQGVEWGDTFLEQLKGELTSSTKTVFETINFGKCGWNTLSEQEFFLKQGVNYKPDILILLFTLNDPEFDGYFLKPIFNSKVEVRYLWRSHLYFFMVKVYNQLKYPYNEYIQDLFKDGSETAKYCRMALNNISIVCRNNNIKPVLVITPIFKDLKNYPFLEAHKKAREWGESCNFYVIDLLPEFAPLSKTGKEFRVSAEDWHPNKEGHKIIAQAVAREILKNNLYTSPATK